jgi:hypothetical protein
VLTALLRRHRLSRETALRYITSWVFALPAVLFVTVALAQTKPEGQAVLNQAKQAAAVTFNQDMTTTRGFYVGDVAPCDASVLFSNSQVAVTLYALRPGMIYPFQIRRVNSTGTTCTASKLIALW